jgi:hypothetical protein
VSDRQIAADAIAGLAIGAADQFLAVHGREADRTEVAFAVEASRGASGCSISSQFVRVVTGAIEDTGFEAGMLASPRCTALPARHGRCRGRGDRAHAKHSKQAASVSRAGQEGDRTFNRQTSHGSPLLASGGWAKPFLIRALPLRPRASSAAMRRHSDAMQRECFAAERPLLRRSLPRTHSTKRPQGAHQ